MNILRKSFLSLLILASFAPAYPMSSQTEQTLLNVVKANKDKMQLETLNYLERPTLGFEPIHLTYSEFDYIKQGFVYETISLGRYSVNNLVTSDFNCSAVKSKKADDLSGKGDQYAHLFSSGTTYKLSDYLGKLSDDLGSPFPPESLLFVTLQNDANAPILLTKLNFECEQTDPYQPWYSERVMKKIEYTYFIYNPVTGVLQKAN